MQVPPALFWIGYLGRSAQTIGTLSLSLRSIADNQSELDSAIGAATQQADARLAATLVAGAPVVSKDAAPVATVQKVEGDNVTLDLAAGGSVALGRSFFAIGTDGKLALTLTAAEFRSAVDAARQAQPAAGATADAAPGTR